MATTHASHEALAVPEFRRERAGNQLRPYDAVMPDDQEGPADDVIEGGWRLSNFPAVRLEPPIAWDEVCAANRSWHYHLHCWDGLGPILARHSATGESRYLEFALEVARDWTSAYPDTQTTSPFAWYDMATALRAYRLGYILDAAARSPEYDDGVIARLLESLLMHREVLADDDRFAAHSNHGFYQAVGQLAIARRFPSLPGMDDAREQASGRLRSLVESQFTAEGVHREHSPQYHLLVLDAFERTLQTGLAEDPWLWERRAPIQEALAWFVLPNRSFAMFGDTEHTFRPTATFQESPALRFVISEGREGAPPAAPQRAFPGSGYVVFRDRWPDGPDDFTDCSYLAQMCAFHSRAHKHADDLSFVWYDRGSELLTDSGRFGYLGKTEQGSPLWREGFWYSDPRRVYVESTRAHNTVEIDGRSYRRRDVKPYGSALVAWGEVDGIRYSEACVRHRRFVVHRRLLFFAPAQWVIVVDLLSDARRRSHSFAQRFHFAPHLEAEQREDSLAVSVPGQDDQLYMTSLLRSEPLPAVRGQEEPELLGWVSHQSHSVMPAWTGGYLADRRSNHAFATLLRFSRVPPAGDLECSGVDIRGGDGQLRWSEGDVLHELSFVREGTRRTPGGVSLTYSVT